MKKPILQIISIFTVCIFLLTIYACLTMLIAFPVMWLWNFVIPQITGWNCITYWQVVCLLTLISILFGGVKINGGDNSK